MALTEDEKVAFGLKLQSEIDSNSITDDKAAAMNSLHEHMKRAYINGASADQAISMRQHNAMVFNNICGKETTAGSTLDIEATYNDAMRISSVFQAKAFNSGRFADVDSAISFCTYVNPNTGTVHHSHEISQVRSDVIQYLSVEDAEKFEWLSQGRMLSTIINFKKTLEDNTLSDDDINTALRFDREYNFTILPILSTLYGKKNYGTPEYNALIEKALNFDYYPQVTLLDFLLRNATKAGDFAVPRPDDGSEVSEEILLAIKSRKDALVSTAESMTPQHELMASLINKALADETAKLQYIAEQNAAKTVRIYTDREFREGDSSNITSKTTLTSQEVEKITLDTYNTWMRVINQEVFAGGDLSSILLNIHDSNFGSTVVGGEEETKEGQEVSVQDEENTTTATPAEEVDPAVLTEATPEEDSVHADNTDASSSGGGAAPTEDPIIPTYETVGLTGETNGTSA